MGWFKRWLNKGTTNDSIAPWAMMVENPEGLMEVLGIEPLSSETREEINGERGEAMAFIRGCLEAGLTIGEVKDDLHGRFLAMQSLYVEMMPGWIAGDIRIIRAQAMILKLMNYGIDKVEEGLKEAQELEYE